MLDTQQHQMKMTSDGHSVNRKCKVPVSNFEANHIDSSYWWWT